MPPQIQFSCLRAWKRCKEIEIHSISLKDEITLNVVARDEDGLFDDQMDLLKGKITLNEKTKSQDVTIKGEISNLSLNIR